MLKIQRASAGSGKTYTLARDFILNLIAFKDEEQNLHLRNEKQIEDALKKILALTFTNKATNEMKVRILDNLALLSMAKETTDPQKLKEIPYLLEFCKLLATEPSHIGESAGIALKVILNNYSLFKISTIDSFFQEILRTFAYEANLNDSYQIEIDSAYVTDAALDEAINELDTNPTAMGNAAFWLRILMQNEAKKSQKWNPFNKRAASQSVYSKIRRALTQLEKEDFKSVKEKLDIYFNQIDPSEITSLYLNLRDRALRERQNQLMEIKSSLEEVNEILNNGFYSEDQLSKTFLNHLEKIASLKRDDKVNFKFNKILEDGSVIKKKYRESGNDLDCAALQMYSLLSQWNDVPADSYYKSWLIYGELLPYLGLIMEVRSFLTNVLETNNLLQLSDTSYILKKIIGNDDSPFVFERLGTRIDNFLVDEFQDTSKMQWEIIYPLLNEGVSKDNDSLIIGDPKQSIYRFRNADHTLISKTVPSVFPYHKAAGQSKEENTNWRSCTRIVLFNNYFFKTLASVISKISKDTAGGADFSDLYSNVVQYPHNQEGNGCVEIKVFPKNSEESPVDCIAPMISQLLERGYRKKDIAILVNTNDNGKEVVEKLIEYNESLEAPSSKIDFISEESLLVSSSMAVSLIIDVIKKLSNPLINDNTSNGEDNKLRYYRWNDLKLHYEIYIKRHPDIPKAENIINFLENPEFYDSLGFLLEDLPSPTVSCITEAIIKFILDEELRKSDAIYLASFQDLVTEFSANHSNDPASFIEWWETQGRRMSISSPEGTDAIQIMTIHKSKGLEFKCVIVPFATDSFIPSQQKEEWRWVKPFNPGDLSLPPVLPVRTSKELIGSYHEDIYNKYFDQVLTDRLNMYYVAFTRAKNELYIFTEISQNNPFNVGNFLQDILLGKINYDAFSSSESENCMNIEDVTVSEDELMIQYGSPLSKEEIEKEKIKEAEKEKLKPRPEKHFFEDYYVNSHRPKLRSKASKVSPSGEME